MRSTAWLVLALLIASAAGCATQQETQAAPVPAAEPAEEPGVVDNQKCLSMEEFERAVAAAGGRVDFVFGKDRPFAQCHASTVAQTADGTLVAAWFGGTKEKDDDVGIWVSRRLDGAWTPPVTAAKIEAHAHWNPVLFTDAAGATHLFFKVGPEIPHWRTYWMTTTDNGASWSAPLELVPGDAGGRGPVKNKPVILSDGAWLAPASTELGDWKPFADRSADRGKTWERSADFAIDKTVLRGKGAIQPTFWESSSGNVHALLRTGAGKVWRADSADYGRTWSPVYATPLPNNNSGLDVLLLEDGRLFMVYNPVGVNWGPRTPLDLAVSTDNGETWTTVAHLENDPNQDSEYSYPGIIRTGAGIAVIYTYNRDTLRCWDIPLGALN